MLVSFVAVRNVTSYPECMIQLYFFIAFVMSECYMLSAMAYDRSVAICNPLMYNVTMSYQVCSGMIGGVYGIGAIEATVHTACTLRVLFCKANVVNHFFCDLLPLLQLPCYGTFVNEVVILCLSMFNFCVPTLTILSSYSFIIARIICMKSTESRFKAFRTCSSHFSVVTVFFGSLAFGYIQPSSVSSREQGKVFSVFYLTAMTILNLLIHSLRIKMSKLY